MVFSNNENADGATKSRERIRERGQQLENADRQWGASNAVESDNNKSRTPIAMRSRDERIRERRQPVENANSNEEPQALLRAIVTARERR